MRIYLAVANQKALACVYPDEGPLAEYTVNDVGAGDPDEAALKGLTCVLLMHGPRKGLSPMVVVYLRSGEIVQGLTLLNRHEGLWPVLKQALKGSAVTARNVSLMQEPPEDTHHRIIVEMEKKALAL